MKVKIKGIRKKVDIDPETLTGRTTFVRKIHGYPRTYSCTIQLYKL